MLLKGGWDYNGYKERCLIKIPSVFQCNNLNLNSFQLAVNPQFLFNRPLEFPFPLEITLLGGVYVTGHDDNHVDLRFPSMLFFSRNV